jgi:hypothetical protein
MIIIIIIAIMIMTMTMMEIIEAFCIVKLMMKFYSTPCYFLRLKFVIKSDKQTNTQKEEVVYL